MPVLAHLNDEQAGLAAETLAHRLHAFDGAALPFVLGDPFVGNRLERVVRRDLARESLNSLFGRRIEAGGDLFSRLVAVLARRHKPYFGPAPK